MTHLAVLKTFNTRLEAEVAQSFLRSSEIDSVIQADDVAGMNPFPFAPSSEAVKLLVAENLLQEARRLLENL